MIALSSYKLASYLVDLQLCDDISWKDVYTLTFVQAGTSRNNCFYSLDKTGKNNYFLKQPRAFLESNLRDMRSEAQFYYFVKYKLTEELLDHVPAYVRYDDYNGVIVTKYLPSFQPLESLRSRLYKDAGKTLLLFHEVCKEEVIKKLFLKGLSEDEIVRNSHNQRSWINDFRSYEPLVIRLTSSEREDLARKNNPYFHQLLAFLDENLVNLVRWRSDWKAGVRGIIHGDAASRNFGMDADQFKIIDFEYVCYGAWFWDLAVFTANLLLTTTVPEIVPPRSGTPPADVYPLIVNFCEGYGITDDNDQCLILHWAGIYLLQFFLSSGEYFHLQFGITLITRNVECRHKIFN